MKKFKCHSDKPQNYPGFVIEGNFPDEIMICFPIKNLGKIPLENTFLLIPEDSDAMRSNDTRKGRSDDLNDNPKDAGYGIEP